MMNFKRMLPLLGLLILSTVTFVACEQGFSQDEVEFRNIEKDDGPRKKYSTVTCLTPNDNTTIITSCQGQGDDCRKRKICPDVAKLSPEDYQIFLIESFSD